MKVLKIVIAVAAMLSAATIHAAANDLSADAGRTFAQGQRQWAGSDGIWTGIAGAPLHGSTVENAVTFAQAGQPALFMPDGFAAQPEHLTLGDGTSTIDVAVAIPEASTYAMMGAGLAILGLGALRRHRRERRNETVAA